MTSTDHTHPNPIAGVLGRVKGPAGVKSLAGLAGAACAACCIIPLLLAAGVLAGAGWSAVSGPSRPPQSRSRPAPACCTGGTPAGGRTPAPPTVPAAPPTLSEPSSAAPVI